MFSEQQLKNIFNKTNGHCHFCGDKIIFEKYGVRDIENINGVWEVDHIYQKAKGGETSIKNCLAACYKCNRLRWHRLGEEIRDLIFFGLIVKSEIKKDTVCGKRIVKLKEKRLKNNEKRRRKLK